jgi:hypothetical protein
MGIPLTVRHIVSLSVLTLNVNWSTFDPVYCIVWVKSLRRIINIKWTDNITNKELWRITKQKPIEIQIKRRKWNWIGHTLRKEAGAIEKTALDWNPQGYTR